MGKKERPILRPPSNRWTNKSKDDGNSKKSDDEGEKKERVEFWESPRYL
jgi:hypothetical protein